MPLLFLISGMGLRRAGDQASLGEFSASFWDLRPALDLPLPVAADPRVGDAFQRHWRPAAALGLVLFVAGGVAAFAALDARIDPFTGMDLLLHDLGVRRHPATRFLFGLKP